MKMVKKGLSLLLVMAVLFSVVSISCSNAKSKPRLSDTNVIIDCSNGIAYKNVKILGIKKSTIKSVEFECSNEIADAYWSKYTPGRIQISGLFNGSSKVTATVHLKKSLNGKKKFKWIISVTVINKADRNNLIMYISDRSVEYSSEYLEYRVFFSLMNSNKERKSTSGKATIIFTNDAGEKVYENTVAFSPADFSDWTAALTGTKLLCCIHIPLSQITPGKSNKGSVSLHVETDNGASFEESKHSVSNLPLISAETVVKIELPSTPCLLNDYDYNNKVRYSYSLQSIRYKVEKNSFDDLYKVTLYFSGNKTYDYRGTGQSSTCAIGYKLYKSGSNVVAESGTAYTPALNMSDSFEDTEETIYNLPAGDYKLEVLNTN